MNIAWLFAENTVLPPDVDIDQIKDLAPIWGSWRTQRGYKTDNVICHDTVQANKLFSQGYADICNLFLHQTVWEQLNSPANVRRYAGEFHHTVESTDDIVGMHLASSFNTIVLMVGFDFAPKKNPSTARADYLGLAAQVMQSTPKCQWVMVDHVPKLAKPFDGSKNITCDNLKNVLHLLSNYKSG